MRIGRNIAADVPRQKMEVISTANHTEVFLCLAVRTCGIASRMFGMRMLTTGTEEALLPLKPRRSCKNRRGRVDRVLVRSEGTPAGCMAALNGGGGAVYDSGLRTAVASDRT